MQPRPKVWIPTIIALFIASFLLGFAPIRRVQTRGFIVESVFAFRFSEALVESDDEMPAKQKEISELLEEQNLELDHAELHGRDLLEVETIALDQDQADSDHDTLIKVLNEKYGALSDAKIPGRQEQEQEPVAKWGPIAIYRPVPQLRLGLDLQGGAHVVLRCLPNAEATFTSPEDKPLIKKSQAEEEAEEEGEEASAYQPPHTAETLKAAVLHLLASMGAKPSEVTIKVPGSNRLLVQTRPSSQDEAEKQNQAVIDYLHDTYPGVDIEEGELSVVLVEAETADKVKYIIEQRLYALGEIREPVIQKQGDDRIIVEMPGVKDPQRVLDILKNTALLEFRLVPANYTPVSADNYDEWKNENSGQIVGWDLVRAESGRKFSGSDLMPNAKVQSGQTGDWVVAFELKSAKKDDFHEFTRENVKRIMAIVLDEECMMAPTIRTAIPGAGVIEGDMTAQEAGDLRLLLNAGALPVPLEIVENRTVSATLGQDSIMKSLYAAFVGVAGVMIFMIAYYRLPGVLADLALLLYMALVVAVTAYSGSTLTLPGIAGIILSLGTAVDANVIIFERLKEEIWSGKSMRSAVSAGFDRAWTAILDANVTTLITAAVLYWLGTSLIKGFAVMLFIGIVCHLFTAITVTRWLLTMVCEAKWAHGRRLYGVPERDKDEAEQPQPA